VPSKPTTADDATPCVGAPPTESRWQAALDRALAPVGGRDGRIGRIIGFAVALAARYGAHRGSLSAGGIAFFAALSLAPMTIAIGALAGLVIDPERLREGMAALIDQTPAASALQPLVDQLAALAESTSVAGITVTGLVGLLIAVFAASRVVAAGRAVLDVAFDHPYEGGGVRARLFATLVTLLAMVVVLVVITLVTVLPAVLDALGIDGWFITAVRGPLAPVISLAVTYLAVRALYARGPRRPDRIGFWSPGAAAAAVWLVAVGIGLDVYAVRSATLGVAAAILGGAAVLLLWIYLCAVGLVLGAEWEGMRLDRRRAAAADDSQAA
jgi:membrane protein